jgi:hypothetical protein
MGAPIKEYGRVEAFSNGTWVAVCDQGFDVTAARVVCRAVGFTEAKPQCCSALGGNPTIGLKVGLILFMYQIINS